jgi:hypothetical protein
VSCARRAISKHSGGGAHLSRNFLAAANLVVRTTSQFCAHTSYAVFMSGEGKQRMNLSLAEDVALALRSRGNASAFVEELVRSRQRLDRSREMLARHGIAVTEDGVRAAGAKLAQADERRRAAREQAG